MKKPIEQWDADDCKAMGVDPSLHPPDVKANPTQSSLLTVDLGPVDEGVPLSPELTTVCTTNDEGLARLVHLYARPGQRVIDPTWGRGVFWKKVPTEEYDLVTSDLAGEGIDMRDMPYEDESADLVVLDPPYRYTPTKNQKHGTNKPHGEVDALYNLQASAPTRTQGVITLYEDGMHEAHRVLKLGGFCIVKCQDTVQDGRNMWVHCILMAAAEEMDYAVRDLLVVAPASVTQSRWTRQRHLRKGHSYFLVLRKGGHFPFGMPSTERR